MKNSIAFLALFISTILLSLVLPWWIVAPLAFIICYFGKPSPIGAFILSFFSVALSWLLSIYFIDSGSIAILLADIFEIPSFASPLLASFIGGIVASLFGLSGSLIAAKKKNWVNG